MHNMTPKSSTKNGIEQNDFDKIHLAYLKKIFGGRRQTIYLYNNKNIMAKALCYTYLFLR